LPLHLLENWVLQQGVDVPSYVSLSLERVHRLPRFRPVVSILVIRVIDHDENVHTRGSVARKFFGCASGWH
jgi:hypothetical protein